MTLSEIRCEVDPLMYLEDVMSAYPTGRKFIWPDELYKQNYTNYGRYNPINILPTRFQMYNDIAFILTPRYREGIPSTLNTMKMSGNKMAAKLEPWPCLKVNNDEDPCAILNAVDLVLDDEGILWLLDIGEGNTLGPPPYNFYPSPRAPFADRFNPVTQPPRVLGINIFNGKLEYRIEMGSYISESSRLQYIQVETSPRRGKLIYVTDAGTRSILMFEVSEGQGYRVILPSCLDEGDLNTDILYIALVPRRGAPTNLLFVTYLSSRRMFVILTEKLWTKKEVGELMLVGSKPGPMVILGVDNQRRMFFRMRGEGDVFMWNVEDEFLPRNFEIVRISDSLRGTHVGAGYYGFVWLLESNFHDYVRGTTGCLGPAARILPLINMIY